MTPEEFFGLLRGAQHGGKDIDFASFIKKEDDLWGEVSRGETTLTLDPVTHELIMHRVSVWLFIYFQLLFLQEKWRSRGGKKFARFEEPWGYAGTETLAAVDYQSGLAVVQAVIRALMEEFGLEVFPEHLDFGRMLNLYGSYEYPSSVYPGRSKVHVIPVHIDLADLGFKERLWPDGRMVWDHGTQGALPTIMRCEWGSAPEKMVEVRSNLVALQTLRIGGFGGEANIHWEDAISALLPPR